MTGLGTGGTIINGNRGNSNNLTVDGGFNLDSGSNASMINNVGIDFIEQVAIQTSNFAADKGRNAGASINVVTTSGTNRFGGSTFLSCTGTTSSHSANYFAPQDPSGKRIKAKEDFHNYGGGVGGPIVKNKLFFFTGMEFRSLDRQESPQRRTLPTRAELRGDFSARVIGPDGVAGTADDNGIANSLINPATGAAFPGHVIPQSLFTADGRAIANVYERMIGLAAEYNDAPIANNTTFQLDFPVRLPAGPRARRLPAEPGARVLRALPARQVRPDRAARHVHRRGHADDPDQPRPSGLRRPGSRTPGSSGQNLFNDFKADRVVERPADSAGRRQLEARDLRLPVPAGRSTAAATTPRAFPASRSPAPARPRRSSARRSRCCRRRPTSRS